MAMFSIHVVFSLDWNTERLISELGLKISRMTKRLIVVWASSLHSSSPGRCVWSSVAKTGATFPDLSSFTLGDLDSRYENSNAKEVQ